MKFLKRIFIIGLVISSLWISKSCTDLDETLYDRLSADKVDMNDPQVRSQLMGMAFAHLRWLYWGWNGYFDLMEECTDTYMTPRRIGVGWGDLYILMHKHTWSYTQGHIHGLWDNAYRGIMYTNMALDVLPETGRDQATMRFLRALNYYILLDAFRNVPLITTADLPGGYLPTQVSGTELFDFIVSEMNAIKDDLGTHRNFGYPNRWAANMVLAKMYLNRNAWFRTNDVANYEDALDEVEEILLHGEYSLAPHYLDNFRQEISGSPEVIFGIPLDPAMASHNYLVNKALVGVGARAFGFTGTPWNGSAAVPQFIDSYAPGDRRLGWTWAGGLQRAATVVDGKTIPQSGAPIPFTTHDPTGLGFLNYSRKVHSIDDPGAYQQQGYRFIKSEIVPGTVGTGGNDVAFFRLADAKFIKAECLLRLGRDKQIAADLVTKVRRRSFDTEAEAVRTVAQLEGGSVYPYGRREHRGGTSVTTYDVFINEPEGGADIILGGLLDDLAWEFVGEHRRRQDLIRFKMTDGRNVFTGKSWFCKVARPITTNYRDIFPIPKAAIDANINLVQNPGY